MNGDQKLAGVSRLENEYRLLTDGKLSPNASPIVSAHVSPVQSDCESEGEERHGNGGSSPESSLPLPSEKSAVPSGGQALPDSKRPRRSLSPDCGLQSSQSLLYGLVSNCSEEQCSALFEQLRARQSQLDIEREGRERDAALNCDSDPDLAVSGV